MKPSEQAHAVLVKAREALDAFRADRRRLNQNLDAVESKLEDSFFAAIGLHQVALREEIEPPALPRLASEAVVPPSSQPVPLSPARPQEGGVPTHSCSWGCHCEGVPI